MKKFISRVMCSVVAAFCLAGYAVPASAQTPNPFSFTLTKAAPEARVPVLSGAGTWTYTYSVKGKITQLSLSIKNYAPGAADYCWVTNVRQPKGTNVVVFAYDVFQAQVAACGTQWPDPDAELWSVARIDTADATARVDVTVSYPPHPVQ